MNVLFITTSNLAINPRLVKELRTCIANGHKVTVIYFEFVNWSKPLNDQIKGNLRTRATFISLAGDRKAAAGWLFSSLANIFSKALLPLISKNKKLLTVSSFKRSALLYAELKTHKEPYDWVIAHNPGAFLPAHAFAKKRCIKLGIDLEDFHPGESDHPAKKSAMEKIVQNALIDAKVITAASGLILEHSLRLCPNHQATTAVVNNVFPLEQQPPVKENLEMPLKLIWFSQTVGLDRGLQDVIAALNSISSFPIHFTIVGSCTGENKMYLEGLLKEKGHRLRFLQPVKETQLAEECSRHHIGLALETAEPLNRDLCLTNKLFVYLLSGNAIVASQTAAQKAFLNDHPSIGQAYPIGDFNRLAAILLSYQKNPLFLKEQRLNAYQLAKTKYNWNREGKHWASLYGLN